MAVRVWVNSSHHQFAADLSSASKIAPKDFQHNIMQKLPIPYDVYEAHHDESRPRKVLILGAGTGDDVNIALANGVSKILPSRSIGDRLSWRGIQRDVIARVRTVLDDARDYLRTSREKFAPIVFGTLDSRMLLSGASNIRLENHVHTQQSFHRGSQPDSAHGCHQRLGLECDRSFLE